MHFSTENYSTAAEYFERALESSDLKDFPDRFRLYLNIGDCHRKKGSYADAQHAFDRARELMGEEASSTAHGQIEYREAFVLFSQGNYDEALRKGYRAYRRLKTSDEHRDVAYTQLLLAGCYQRLGLVSEAEDFYADALSSFRRIDDRVGIAYVYNNLGLLHKNACRWNRALASLSKSLELAKSLGLTQHMVLVNLNLGVVHLKLRRFADALAAFSKTEEMAERLGDQYNLTKAWFMKGRAYIFTGEHCKAERYILRAQAAANEHSYLREAALTDEFLGELMMARGKPEAALVNLKKGMELARSIAPEGDVVAEIWRRMADVYYSLNRIDDAQAAIEEGLEVAHRCGEFYEIGYFHRTRGMCHVRRREFDEAVTAHETSVEVFDRYENKYEKLRSQQQLARLYLRVDRGDQSRLLKAKQLLSEATIGFSQIEEAAEQMLSQVLLAVAEEQLGNLDESLLAIYEADRLAEDEQNSKYKKLLNRMRTRVEGKMTRDTQRVLEQIPMFGDIQTGARSRDKLVRGLTASLKLIIDKLNASAGFVAIPRPGGGRLEVACTESVEPSLARPVLEWFLSNNEGTADHSLAIVDVTPRTPGLPAGVSERAGALVFQQLGFEGEQLGLIGIFHERVADTGPVNQEALHFLGAYSRLISLSVYELVRNEKRREPKARPTAPGFERIVTENNDMIKLLNLAERVAHSNATVLLQGETGTGKGLISYAIHLLSDRRDKRFVHVNCAAMPETLLESELFGHVKGAFTGAHADKAGLLREADGGTIFLDEIGKTSLTMQGKLLQFLDTGKVRMVGSNDLIQVDVRVICASKQDLLQKCQEGTFLEDFFYRINDFPLVVPPLRKRREDVELLFFHYLRKYSHEMGKTIDDITDVAMERLRTFRWPGNVRELEKVVKRAVILADSNETLDLQHLPPEVASGSDGAHATGLSSNSLREKIDQLERREIQAALDRAGWNKSQAAVDLGISYPSLLSKIKRYHLRAY